MNPILLWRAHHAGTTSHKTLKASLHFHPVTEESRGTGEATGWEHILK
jgi:hypothetical protein